MFGSARWSFPESLAMICSYPAMCRSWTFWRFRSRSRRPRTMSLGSWRSGRPPTTVIDAEKDWVNVEQKPMASRKTDDLENMPSALHPILTLAWLARELPPPVLNVIYSAFAWGLKMLVDVTFVENLRINRLNRWKSRCIVCVKIINRARSRWEA